MFYQLEEAREGSANEDHFAINFSRYHANLD